MLAVSPLTSATTIKEDESQEWIESFTNGGNEEFPDLLESINFDDLFMGIKDGDLLPDLEKEMDPEILADFSSAVSGGTDESEVNNSVSSEKAEEDNPRKYEEDKVSGCGLGLDSGLSARGEEIASKKIDESLTVSKESDKSRKSSSQSKNNNNNNQGKRKVKVDWSPELHRRFVLAVEQLGVDKAVPSRILELMGIDCLTRHNIASHLQKYRSHRKHLIAREEEAATWSHRRQMYGSAVAAGGGGGKRNMIPWHAPTTGFPPPITPIHHHPNHPSGPLHVWGHPPMEQPLMHTWLKHLPHPPSPPPPPYASYWHHHQHQQWVPNGFIPGTPCFPQLLTPTRFSTPPVPGIPPHAMYKIDSGVLARQSGLQSSFVDFRPSKESIDAAIGDVLAKPWLPLPLGLKPPSIDGVLGELQRQGVAKIPTTTCT